MMLPKCDIWLVFGEVFSQFELMCVVRRRRGILIYSIKIV